MRYDSENHLTAWRDTGRFPAIHDPLWNLIGEESQGQVFLDLCCSTGLLGTRILTVLKRPCIGIEADAAAIQLARQHGIPLPMTELRLGVPTLDQFMELVETAGVQTILARRCIPELFGYGPRILEEFVHQFTGGIARRGVCELFIEGRKPTARATHPIPDLDTEIRVVCLSGHFRVSRRSGDCAYLERT